MRLAASPRFLQSSLLYAAVMCEWCMRRNIHDISRNCKFKLSSAQVFVALATLGAASRMHVLRAAAAALTSAGAWLHSVLASLSLHPPPVEEPDVGVAETEAASEDGPATAAAGTSLRGGETAASVAATHGMSIQIVEAARAVAGVAEEADAAADELAEAVVVAVGNAAGRHPQPAAAASAGAAPVLPAATLLLAETSAAAPAPVPPHLRPLAVAVAALGPEAAAAAASPLLAAMAAGNALPIPAEQGTASGLDSHSSAESLQKCA